MSGKTKQARKPGTEPTETAPSVPESAGQPSATESNIGNGGLRVPIPTVGVRMARVPLPPGSRTAADGVSSVLHRVPDRESMLYYGGLGAAAATGLVSWPVATAIGVGVWVAEHARNVAAAGR
ncbi:hypothetical protein SAMN04244553_1296 [Nocardia amikacinitolerans]|uniref:Uncharacterized protein n=1 Tax=Nocardia amikacinitolerans TaxID=756689 RepID=A0A285L4X6_9NOCA|nr:hypothetical protein [Nocardia amikacinitolerans]MCP2279387.1 hypothetical protein [Nocardia amikacinitolerans]MCP2296816.1 hypothetical protein [Nocardia amikacinitolerans]SNY78461.1 hypothetical protein SAMN04244553_1296 [Nocardia amikacinitolerans]